MEQSGDSLNFDVIVVGAGVAGLTAAIHLKQLARQKGSELSVCILEKGAAVGDHILSGNVFEPRALTELFPDWKERGAPLETAVDEDQFLYLMKNRSHHLPIPPQMHNKGNFIISLASLCRWLATQAEDLGVEIYPGFSAATCLFNEAQKVIGVQTTPQGLNAAHVPTDRFESGVNLYARYTFFAEGCRGSLSQQLIHQYNLAAHVQPQTYALGLKEIWEISAEHHHLGRVTHTVGWPLDRQTYGGSFFYHMKDSQLAFGLVIGLDYPNPYLNPFEELQRLKCHPHLRPLFEQGRRLSYGARALNEGGWQSIPQLSFPGGCLIGCGAGFLNVPKIKGAHTAMKSALLAADVAFENLSAGKNPRLGLYDQRLKQSWVRDELYPVRNIRPGFRAGFWLGFLNAALETYIFRGCTPWTWAHSVDHKSLRLAARSLKINYPKPDGKITFDRLSSVYLSNTNHREDQPCHLTLKNPLIPINHNLKYYDSPEQRYCPAGVYEIIIENRTQRPHLHINAQNCVHCKTCDIKDPLQNIVWVTPEGSGGPRYSNM